MICTNARIGYPKPAHHKGPDIRPDVAQPFVDTYFSNRPAVEKRVIPTSAGHRAQLASDALGRPEVRTIGIVEFYAPTTVRVGAFEYCL